MRWRLGSATQCVKGLSSKFTGSHEVEVNGERLTAPQIFINTGGRPAIPDWPGLNRVPYLTNVSMMDLAELPSHLVIAGGSYVGLEFAQMFRRFGSAVTVIEHGERLIARENGRVLFTNERALLRAANYTDRYQGLDLSWLPTPR